MDERFFVSDLIKALDEIKEKHGDVEIYDDDGNVEKSFNLGQLKEFVNQLK